MSTILVTGGAGFVGANLVRHALRHTSDRIVVIDNLTYAGNLASLTEMKDHPRFVFVKADICDSQAVDDALLRFRPRAVVNLAAESHVDRSIDGPRAFVQTNLCGTFELLEASRNFLRTQEVARERFRFVHVSTDEVYGSLGAAGSFVESHRYAPNSPYAATKAGADHLVHAYFETFALPTLITNCSNNYGPFQYPEKLIPLMVRNALDAMPLPIYGDGRHIRDWLHVEDHCKGILAVLDRGKPGQRYNIGGANERDNLSIVDAICSILERLAPARANPVLSSKGIARYDALKTFVPDRPGHDRRYSVDASKIRRELGWSPHCHFEAGLEQTVAWYLSNRPWCETVERSKGARKRVGLMDTDGV